MPDIYYQNRYATLYHGDCRDVMDSMKPDSIDLTVTSPPYDDLRSYEDSCEWNFDVFREVADGLWKVTKPGGVIVWVVNDSTVNGSETGTSFRQALHFKEIGFNIHDTMIWNKGSFSFPSRNCYHQVFEYMFVFSKGVPKSMHFIEDRKNLYLGGRGASGRNRDGSRNEGRSFVKNEYGKRFNIWDYPIGGGHSSSDSAAYEHPAIFPDQLAMDHISSWSDEGDTVFEPFCGSGTTGVACMKLNRKCILCEKVDRYCDIASRRLEGGRDLFNMYEE